MVSSSSRQTAVVAAAISFLLLLVSTIVVEARLGGGLERSRKWERNLQDTSQQQKPLIVVGNNGNPPERFPLALCEGDCDNDNQCQEGLICSQRGPGDHVPDCVGDLMDQVDYCVLVPKEQENAPGIATATAETMPSSSSSTTVLPSSDETIPVTTVMPTGAETIALTETVSTVAPTESSEEALMASTTTASSTVTPTTMDPTSVATESVTTIEPTEEEDITLFPSSTESPTNSATSTNTIMTTTSITQQPTVEEDSLNVAVGVVMPDETFPLLTVGNDGNFPAYPLLLCHGDCDVDEDCMGDLICLQRIMDEPVPGCYGRGDFSIDYCVHPFNLVVSSAFEQPQGVAAGGVIEVVGKPIKTEAPISATAEVVSSIYEEEHGPQKEQPVVAGGGGGGGGGGLLGATTSVNPKTVAPSVGETDIGITLTDANGRTDIPSTDAPSAGETAAVTDSVTMVTTADPTLETNVIASIFEQSPAQIITGVVAGGTVVTGVASSTDGDGDRGSQDQ